MAKRVFEIAKDLGIKSKAIVDKCHAEGIPADVIKNHMSTVSVGLEQTIREWFTSSEDASHTAVETAEKVDLDKVREAPKKKARSTSSDADGDDDAGVETQTAVAEPPTRVSPARPVPVRRPPPAAPSKLRPTSIGPSTVETPPAKPAAASQPEAPEDQAPPAERPAAAAQTKAPEEPKPAPMNVPTRPKVVTPAGRKLEEKQQVKLSGPKVVRIEAPEQIESPRRRPPRPGGGGPGMAPAGPMDMPGDDRSGRRGNRRRTTGGAGVPAKRRGRADMEGSGYTEADLAEREMRLQRAGGYLKQRRQQLRRQTQGDRPASPAERGGKVSIAAPFTIKDLSAATGVKGAEIVKQLFMQGVMATINSPIESEKAQEIMMEYDIELEVTEAKTAEQKVSEEFAERDVVDERPRGPVVTILGHVDHGKTSLLDKIRNANVAAGEAGGITQATSAFRVPVKVGDEEKQVVFIDTPGHEAFTEMRSRGANVTDIVVLVVAADDGVMPQTVESISHAKAAGVPIVVALNKIDKPEATDTNIQRILGQLAEHDLNPVDWGGDTEVVRTSATKGEGITELLEILDLQAQVLELKADFGGPARGTVIEARPEEGRGAVANILLQDGELKVGDFIVAGRAYGRVRDITDDHGTRIRSALPPMPVQISGIDMLPDAGDKFYCVDTLKKAEQAAEQRRHSERERQLAQPKLTLDRMFDQMAERELKEIRVVLKADVQGSVDVLKHEIEKVSGDEVKVRVIHAAVGGITDSDILLADASQAVIVGFNVIANAKGRSLAEQKGVEIRNYQVIYDIVEDMRKAAEGLLAPELRQEVIGHAEVRKVFKVTKAGWIAGCYVTDGLIQRDALVRVTRDGIVVENDRKLEQLKRFKDDVKEVKSNMECGMKIAGYDDIKEGDVLECYKQVEVKRTL
ncbi:MAG: translation initiation factor IF-2 [Phycisphaerales bacterium]